MSKELEYIDDQLLTLSFGTALREIRYREEMTTTEIATKSGISQPYISQLENDVRIPSNKVINKLATALARGKDNFDPFISNREDGYTDLYTDELQLEKRQNHFYKLLLRIKEANVAKQKEAKEIIPLSDFINDLKEEETGPLKNNEFMLAYKDEKGIESSIRSPFESVSSIFDLSAFLTSNLRIVTNGSNGITYYGKPVLNYRGKELTHDDKIKIIKVLDAIFEIEN